MNKNQILTNTAMNRYPDIFKNIQASINFLKNKQKVIFPRVLSFGCSSGEEVLTMNSQLEDCLLFGYDVNDDVISTAKKNLPLKGSSNLIFFSSDFNEINASKKFNLITIFSVLCLWPQTKDSENISKIYSFDLFESTLNQLDELLASGGLIYLTNANYFFEDTDLFKKYIPHHPCQVGVRGSNCGFVHRFERDGSPAKRSTTFLIFEKR